MPAYAKAATAALAARQVQWAGPHLSPLGTPEQPKLPPFMTNNPLPQGYPWGPRTAKNTNYYQDTPNTGVTRYYDWTISKEPCNVDGYENTCLFANNQFPGPMIEANWGDWISVKVTNAIPDEGTAIHWHGLLQQQTPWEDGVPGYGQCPIAPGATFTYNFQADLYGTTWWHAHYSSQYGSGLWGPLVIYGPQNVEYDADLGPVMMSDYYHEYYETAVEALLAPVTGPQTGPPAALEANNNLINGKTNNGGQTASFNVTSGKTYRIRLVNPSAAAVQKFTIDGSTFTIFANDFVPIEPYETDHVTLAVGQRTDILWTASGNPTDSVWMRAYRPPGCSPSAGNEEVQAAIFYEDADRSQPPTTSPGPNAYNSYCGNDPLSQTIPAYPMAAGDPSVTEILPIEFKSNGTTMLWYMANRTFYGDYNDPLLLEAKLGNLDFPYLRNVHNYGTNSSVRIILENTGNQPHPMHLHGHNIFILAEGNCSDTASTNQTVFGNSAGHSEQGQDMVFVHPDGSPMTGPAPPRKRELKIDYGTRRKRDTSYGSCWDGSITNADNPQRRDVQMLLPGQYIVIQWFQDNPGMWALHCHIAWHLSAGFVWNVLENPGAIESEMQIPSVMAQTCNQWAAYSNTHVVDQIDDGI